jgi:hypothetical protein
VHAEQATSAGEMPRQTDSRSVHPLERPRLLRVADVDDEQGDATRIGERVLDLACDVHAEAEVLDEGGQPGRRGGEVVPRVDVGSGPLHDQGVRHRAS